MAGSGARNQGAKPHRRVRARWSLIESDAVREPLFSILFFLFFTTQQREQTARKQPRGSAMGRRMSKIAPAFLADRGGLQFRNWPTFDPARAIRALRPFIRGPWLPRGVNHKTFYSRPRLRLRYYPSGKAGLEPRRVRSGESPRATCPRDPLACFKTPPSVKRSQRAPYEPPPPLSPRARFPP